MTLSKQFIKLEWMHKVCLFHSSTKVSSPAADLISRPSLLPYDATLKSIDYNVAMTFILNL